MIAKRVGEKSSTENRVQTAMELLFYFWIFVGRMARGKIRLAVLMMLVTTVTPTVGHSAARVARHEFEDGHVERSVAIVVRNDVITIEYSIGLNPNTRTQLQQHWLNREPNSEQPTRKQLSQTTEPSSGKSDVVQETPGPTGQAGNPVETEEVDFLALAGKNIAELLEVSINGRRQGLELVSVSVSPRHHVDLTVTWAVKLKKKHTGKSVRFELVDNNFDHRKTANNRKSAPFYGGFRYALKASGGSILTKSNVAPILIRAERKLDKELKTKDFLQCRTVEATLIVNATKK